ncbi:MAG: sugar phosphate isomerase/epimerase [Pirellulaceae bacterium]|nr:sugar phosphate isomerase/epimerase [Pirellulaceae bacterium]
MNSAFERRNFLKLSAAALTGAALATPGWSQDAQAQAKAAKSDNADKKKPPLYKISLAQWSLHKTLFAGKLDNRDFAKTAKTEFNINAIEYVNQFFKDKAEDKAYLEELKSRHEEHKVRAILIMIDGEGALGDSDEAKRTKAVENHYKWVEAAKTLGCHSIRVNAQSPIKEYEEAKKLASDGLRRLSQFAADRQINVIVENHGGLSSNGKWLSETIAAVGLDNCGTLPDFGNFYEYDRYQGVTDLMGKAKAVSAKSYEFDASGNETKIDYAKMMKIVVAAGYKGHVGIEYEGKQDEYEGIRATKKLLLKVRKELSA